MGLLVTKNYTYVKKLLIVKGLLYVGFKLLILLETRGCLHFTIEGKRMNVILFDRIDSAKYKLSFIFLIIFISRSKV